MRFLSENSVFKERNSHARRGGRGWTFSNLLQTAPACARLLRPFAAERGPLKAAFSRAERRIGASRVQASVLLGSESSRPWLAGLESSSLWLEGLEDWRTRIEDWRTGVVA